MTTAATIIFTLLALIFTGHTILNAIQGQPNAFAPIVAVSCALAVAALVLI